MSSAFRIVFALFILLALPRLSIADNTGQDKWFGKDKFQHFAVSAFYSGGIAVAANRHFETQENDSIVLGAAITISLGGVKEIYDHSRPKETSSVKDFIWDIGGATLGSLLAALIL